jgi:dihydrolipoamide dehydrogenase
MIARKQAIVDQTTGGVKYLMDKNKITVLEGLGSFVDATRSN